jgi:hypothetical protein
VGSFPSLGSGCQLLAVWRYSEADDLAVGRGDHDLALADGREDVTGEARSADQANSEERKPVFMDASSTPKRRTTVDRR